MALLITAQEKAAKDSFTVDEAYHMEPMEDLSGFVLPEAMTPEVAVLEIHSPPEAEMAPTLEVGEPEGLSIVVEDLPGVEELNPEMEKKLEVSENDDKNSAEEVKDTSKEVKDSKWDWGKKGPAGFVVWVKERVDNVPRHSGYDTAGVERAISYLEKLDNEISKAMRMDLDGELDANKIEEVRAQIEEGIGRLHDRLDKISKKNGKRKKRSDLQTDGLIKQGQKIPTVHGIVITVPLLISRIARVCMNSMVSSGKDIERVFAEQCEKYKLNDREQAEVIQLLYDFGVAFRIDRGHTNKEDVYTNSVDNYDWLPQYYA